ncbi:hypothetical protein [Burkholderia phage vB_BglM_WTB]
MNIIKDLTRRMIASRETNKTFPCQVYASEKNAEKAMAALAQKTATYFSRDKNPENARPANYVVFYIAEWDKWVGAINLSEVIARRESTGGYLGICGNVFVW